MIFLDSLAVFITLKGVIQITFLMLPVFFRLESCVCSLRSFLTNKANFRNAEIGICFYITSNYEISSAWRGVKTKPIQTQSKPILGQYQGWQTQTNPNQTQSKPSCFLFTVSWSCCPNTLSNNFHKLRYLLE